MIQSSSELKELMLHWYASFSSGDIRVTEDLLSQDPALLTIGTDPAEWVMGFAAIAPIYRAQIDNVGGVKIEAGEIRAFRIGDVGWVADTPKITLPDGVSFSMRSTLVFYRDQEVWKLIQQHNSVGVANEDLVGRMLPIQMAEM